MTYDEDLFYDSDENGNPVFPGYRRPTPASELLDDEEATIAGVREIGWHRWDADHERGGPPR